MFPDAETVIPKEVNLLYWLNSKKFIHLQNALRASNDQDKKIELKKKMPCITASGQFSKRGKSYLVKHSGLIAIDIDQKDNLHIQNFSSLKNELSKNLNIAYCGHSVSGSGYFALIPIAYPENHLQHFQFIEDYYKSFGLVIDPACKDISRLRFYSYDPDAYFNHTAKPLEAFYQAPEVKPKKVQRHYFDSRDQPAWHQYNQGTYFINVLESHGWKIKVQDRRASKIYFTRPGKSSGISAEYDSTKNIFFVFTSSTKEFEGDKGYNPFQVYTLLEHNGNFKEASRALMQDA